MTKKNKIIVSVAFVMLAAACVVAFVLLFQARSDINNLQSSVSNEGAVTRTEFDQAQGDADKVEQRVKKVEDQLSTEESDVNSEVKQEEKKAQEDAEIDANKDFLNGNVSLNEMLETVNANAQTANNNYAKIEAKVKNLTLEDESQVGSQ